MSDIYKQLFAVLNNYKYCVLRNAEGLPDSNPSNDVDILIERSNKENLINELINKLSLIGYNSYEYSEFFGIDCYTFYSKVSQLEPIKLDFFTEFSGGGLRYIDFEQLYSESLVNKNGIRVLNHNYESFLNVLKMLLSGGKVKSKYIESLIDSDVVKYQKNYSFLGDVIKDIDLVSSNNDFKGRRKVYFSQIVKYNLRRYGFLSTLNQLKRHLLIELKRVIPKNRFIVICGIDGAGKTTLLNSVIKESEVHFRSIRHRFVVEHHRPRLLPHVSEIYKKKTEEQIKETLENPRTGKRSNFIVSYCKFFYYVIDYSLMFWIKHCGDFRRDKIVIYDRYYFDFLIDPERSALKLNPGIVKLIYTILIPKPDHTIYVTVPGEVAEQRKGELTKFEAEELQNRYMTNRQFWSRYTCIENVSFETSKDELIKAIQISLSKKDI